MIIFISGSINAGKTTVAKILVTKLSKAALVEVDSLRDMISWMPLDQSIEINLENAVSVIKNFSTRKLDVIIPYPLSQKNYEYLTENLKDINTKTYFFTLAPSLGRAIMDRGSRKLNELEIERIKHHYDIGIPKPIFGEIIDNSEQTPDETADIILSKISL